MRSHNVVNPNDGSIITFASEVNEEKDNSEDVEDMENAFGAELISVALAKDVLSTEVNTLSLFYYR